MDFKALGSKAAKSESTSRQIIAGRELQYDADFACYEVADLDEPASKNFRALLDHIDYKRQLAGAETVVAHITLGEKSGREAIATVKPYQENRDPDAPIKVRVRELRHMLANHELSFYSLFHEADDIMVQRQHARIKAHGWDSSVIMSGDKDLWMGQGWHCDPKTGRLYMVKGFGHTEYREVGNVKPKLVGEGRSWFWHQMIMGDKADNIPGLEKISNKDLDRYQPLKSKKKRKAGSAACGEAKAVIVLDGVTNDKLAARLVWELYVNYYGALASVRLFEQAYLLWMQRNEDPFDVSDYLTSCDIPVSPSPEQINKIQEFIKRCGS